MADARIQLNACASQLIPRQVRAHLNAPLTIKFPALYIQARDVSSLHVCSNTHLLVTAADDPGAAELNFHNAWPAADRQALLDMWPPEAAAEVATGAGPARFLLDVSPEYLMNPVVPPRLKQLVPQAKVVVVLQVPPLPAVVTCV